MSTMKNVSFAVVGTLAVVGLAYVGYWAYSKATGGDVGDIADAVKSATDAAAEAVKTGVDNAADAVTP